MLKIDL